MKWMISLILLILCFNIPRDGHEYPNAPHEIWTHLNYFEKTFGIDVKHIKASIENGVNIGGIPVRAKCSFDKGIVVFDSFSWSRFTFLQKRAIVIHELAHCVMMLEHFEVYSSIGCPSSILATSTPDHACLSMNWSYYIKQLNFMFDNQFDRYGIEGFAKPKRNLRE